MSRRVMRQAELTRGATYPHPPGVSNVLRFDALLLRALAAELDARLRGLRVARARFDRAARAVLVEVGPRRQPLTLSWRLQPAHAHVLLAEGGNREVGGLLQVPPGTPIAAVRALADERIVRLEFAPGEVASGLVRCIVLELLGQRWNALALGADDVIAAVLVARRGDPRQLRPGVPYSPPDSRPRLGAERLPGLEEWQALFGGVAPADRLRALLAGCAYASPLNAAWILGDALGPEAGAHVLEEAYRRYAWLLSAPAQPALHDGVQPYPQPLAGDAVRTASLLAAFAAAAASAGTSPPAGEAADRELLLARIHDRLLRVQARREQLAAEARGAAAEAARLRRQADLLMAHLATVPRGASALVLTDFRGEPCALQLDPALTPLHNAQQWYETAKRREHAAERVPALARHAATEAQRLEALRTQVAAGAIGGVALRDWLRRSTPPEAEAALPYRKYRSTNGLEIRVGRNARANDALTRAHSAPDDIWLHAREVGGAHVVLRWGRRDANPPRPDLVEAAVLAAWHSRARTSAVVAVDWTRRKYVRKPRKAAPGLVVLERAKTLFVAPAEDLERRLREMASGV
ncbi:MAG: DUF814 domain-containing protein [Gemmatimonadetes bacterium]|nr:DUF814 domain-containing protein [Gemmatimonadota bacterium]